MQALLSRGLVRSAVFGVGLAATITGGNLLCQTETPTEPSYNRKHYSQGLNHNFSADAQSLNQKFAGDGVFENPSTRDIANCPGEIIRSLGELTHMRVADIGAGTGLMTELIRAAVGETGQVYAVELSSGFRQLLTEKKRANNWSNVQVSASTDSSTGLSTGSIDLALVCDVYHHFETPHAMLADIHRTLSPGGRLVVLDFIRDSRVIWSHPPGWVEDHVRADQATFRTEIESCGFAHLCDIKIDKLRENYIMVFERKSEV